MADSLDLTTGERQWLLAISRGPLSKAAIDRSLPKAILESLIDKRLVRWSIGLLEVTSIGMATAESMRTGPT